MKIKSIFKIFIAILLILFVAWFFASGNIYSASAASNAILNDHIPEQDYEGISINSNIANDFEFLGLDAPESYATGNEKKVITIAEAVYKENGELKKQIVVYFYHPAYKNAALPNEKMQFTFKLSTQHYLINGEYIKQLLLKDYMSDMTDNIYEVAHYNGIKKFTFGSKLNKHLLSDSGSIVGKNTVIKVNLSKTGYFDGYPYNGRIDVAPTKLYQQEFQFISECSVTAGSAKQTNTSICVGYDVNTVSVDGKAVKLRYKTGDILDFSFISSSRDFEYTDIFYCFFNVTDDVSGEKWGPEKYITEVNINYSCARLTYNGHEGLVNSDEITIDYFNGDGYCYRSEYFDNAAYYDPTSYDYLDSTELELIQQKITPEKISLNYLESSAKNTWVAFAGGWYDTQKTDYMTLFNTSSQEFRNILDKSTDYTSDLILNYQFGLVYGDKNGYSAIHDVKENVLGVVDSTVVYYHLEVVDFVDITYNENGETYYVQVSSTEVDNSEIDSPIPGEDDLWQDEPGEPEPSPKNEDSWWMEIYEFFKNIINKIKAFFSKISSFFSSAKSIIIVSVIVVIAIALIITLFKVINFINTARVARGFRKYNKKE